MLTPNEIKEKSFEKAVFGGYDMAAVDEFLENVYGDYSALHKEVQTLKAKMKVLANKIEDYRGSEDIMSRTLLTAQKMGAQIEFDSKQRSQQLLTETEVKARDMIRSATAEVQNEEAKLIEAKYSSARFLEDMRTLCTKQLDFLDRLSEMKIVEGLSEFKNAAMANRASMVEPTRETIKTIENNLAKPESASTPEMDISREIDKISTPITAEDEPTRPFTPITRGFSLDDLPHGEKN